MGLIGAIFRKRGFVAFFSGFLWGSLVINIAVGGYGIYWTLKHASEAEQMCKDRLKDVLNGGNADNAKQVCLNAPLAKGLSIGIFVVAMLFLLCEYCRSLPSTLMAYSKLLPCQTVQSLFSAITAN